MQVSGQRDGMEKDQVPGDAARLSGKKVRAHVAERAESPAPDECESDEASLLRASPQVVANLVDPYQSHLLVQSR